MRPWPSPSPPFAPPPLSRTSICTSPGAVADEDVRLAGLRVPERVGQALLHDSIGREVDRGGQRDALALDLQPHRKARAPELLDQRVEAVEARMRGALGVLTVASHRAEQAAHLAQCRAAGLLDAPERLAVPLELVREVVPDGADLKHHHADGVRDDVVELARDARALLGDCDTRRGLALPLRLRRTQLRCVGALGSLAQDEAGEPADPEQHGREDDLARRVVGVVVDDDRRAGEHDREADSRLRVVREVAEQERRGHAGDERARGEHDQPAVDQGDRRTQEPDRRRCGEREAATCEQRQDDQRHRRHGEPVRRRRLVRRVVPECHLEGALECGDRDQDVEPVPPHERCELAHTRNLLQATDHRLLPG